MRQIILGCLAACASMALAQGKPEAPAGERRIGDGVVNSGEYTQQRLEDSRRRQSNWVDESAQMAGARMSGSGDAAADKTLSPSAPEIRVYVSRLANAMLAPGQLAAAAGLLADADARRILPQMPQVDLREHDNLVLAFREQWKARYGEEFDLARQPSVMNAYYVLRGQRSPEDAIVVSHREMPGNGQTAAPHEQDQERLATMVIPANPEQKQPAMLLVLNNEKSGGTQWRLNAPDTLSAQRLQRNLDQRLARFLDGSVKWPADMREAYRMVSYQALAAINDQPLDRPRERPADEPKPPDRDNASLES